MLRFGMSRNPKVDQRIDEVISNRLQVGVDEFNDSSKFLDDPLNAESLDIIEMAEMLDQEYGIFIPDEDLETMQTVEDVKKYIFQELKRRSPGSIDG